MPPDNFKERRLVKLHPHLEGKTLLIIESPDLFISSSWYNRLKLERIDSEIQYIPRIVDFDVLLKECGADALVIHPAMKPKWITSIAKVAASSIPVVCIQGDEVQKGAREEFQRFKDMGIPIIQKGRIEFYDNLLDALEEQFIIKSR